VTFEEGTCAAWLHDLLKPYVTDVLVCNPRKNALLKVGNKSDRIDAGKLAELLYLNKLSSVYHGENGVRILKELARSYLTITNDLSQVMNRIKAVYRSWAIPCAGKLVYTPRHRTEWLQKLPEAGVRRRAERLYQQLDALRSLRQDARQELLAESRKHHCSSIATRDSLHRSDSSGTADRSDSDSSSFPHQAATLGLQRSGVGHSNQCRISFPG
jgi:transposase